MASKSKSRRSAGDIDDAATPRITPLLERAARGEDALAQLLAAWQQVPAAELADAIASAPADPALAEVTTSNAVDGLARLVRLDSARDPRISVALVGWLADPPWHATGSQPFYVQLFKRLADIADPRAIANLATASKAVQRIVKGKSMRTWLVERIARARTALQARYPAGVPALSPADRALAERAARAAAASPRRSAKTRRTDAADELLAAIRANPADDGARQVYADVLSEKADPRGMFITMQLARAGRAPTAQQTRAELAMLAKHARFWLGELCNVVGTPNPQRLRVGPEPTPFRIRFERGFLAGCRISASEAKIRAVTGHPDLATVEEVYLASWSSGDRHDVLGELLRGTPMPALRRLHVPPELVTAAAACPQITTLAIKGTDLRRGVDDAAALAVSQLELWGRAETATFTAIAAALALPTPTRIVAQFADVAGTYTRSNRIWKLATTTERDNATTRRTLERLAALV